MDRDRFAGPPEHRGFDGPRPPSAASSIRSASSRPTFRWPATPTTTLTVRRRDEMATADRRRPPHSVRKVRRRRWPVAIAKKAADVAADGPPRAMARAATPTKVLATCDEKDHPAVTARRAMATKAAAIGDQKARHVVMVHLQAMALAANTGLTSTDGPGADKPHPPGPPHEKPDKEKGDDKPDAAV